MDYSTLPQCPAFLRALPRISPQAIFLKFNKCPALFKRPPFKRGRLIENRLKKVGPYLKLLSFYRIENQKLVFFVLSILFKFYEQSSVNSFIKFGVSYCLEKFVSTQPLKRPPRLGAHVKNPKIQQSDYYGIIFLILVLFLFGTVFFYFLILIYMHLIS